MDIRNIPLPPPWREEILGDEIVYVNGLNGRKTNTHPLQEYFSQNVEDAENCSSIEYNQSPIAANPPIEYNQDESPASLKKSSSRRPAFLPFRCEWKEVTLNGLCKTYGMDLLYFLDDKKFEITFDGVHASWVLSRIDGPYGPLDETDLFIGAKIKIFDRHLSITSSNSHVCLMIDKRAEALIKRRNWLQQKIEVFGELLSALGVVGVRRVDILY